MKKPQKHELAALLLILAVSLFLNLWNNNFPFGYHVDEPKKVKVIQEGGGYDFHHPLLMLKVVEGANAFLRLTHHQKIVELGRISSGLFGVGIVLFSWLIFRYCIDKKYALIGAFGVAVCPIIVVHAHYFKEDIIYTCFAVCALFLLLRFVGKQSLLNAFLLGMSTGLAVSSKYIGILLILFYCFLPAFLRPIRSLKYYRFLLISVLTALGVFLLVNYPLFSRFEIFKEGVLWDAKHVLEGHDVKVYASQMFFSFHLLYSLGPWMGWTVTGLSLAGMGYSVLNWRKVSVPEQILWLYVFLFYFAVELTPLKAFPDYSRFVIPIVPGMIYFAVQAIRFMEQKLKDQKGFVLSSGLCIVALVLPFYSAVQLVYHLDKDTREEAKEWMKAAKEKVMCEKYVFTYQIIRSLADVDINVWKSRGFSYLVASSFQYDRYFFGRKLEGQDPEIYRAYERYKKLFSYPYREIKPAYKSYAFSNPVIRIIDIRNPSQRE